MQKLSQHVGSFVYHNLSPGEKNGDQASGRRKVNLRGSKRGSVVRAFLYFPRPLSGRWISMKCYRPQARSADLNPPELCFFWAWEHQGVFFVVVVYSFFSPLHTTVAGFFFFLTHSTGNFEVLPVFNLCSIFKLCHPGRCDRALAEPRCYFTCLSLVKNPFVCARLMC